MPKYKTHKATAKRIKITKKKKMIQRTAGQNHFNAREKGKVTKNKRKDRRISKSNIKAINKLIR